MYYKTKIKDIVRIPPYKFGEPLNEVAIQTLNETYEGRLDKKLGLLICVNAIEEIGEGNAIVDNTMEAINTVLANMEAFAGMANGASEASKVQVSMLKEVEVGIEKITTVVQNNSSTAQETSAVSEELSAQATTLEEMIEKFQLKAE